MVMTTEVLRNMLYAGSATLKDLGYVVLDEVHYLADRSRGAVWEEVIIHLPESVRVVALSATVSNAEEFGDWLAQVRGGTEVIVDEHRPVPLWQHMLAGRRLYDLFTDDNHRQVNPDLVRLARREEIRQPASRPGRGGHRPKRNAPPYRPEIIDRLDAAGLLPAITFIFSRAGCDAAVQQCLQAGLRLTTPAEAEAIEAVASRRTSDIPDEDLAVLGYHDWVLALRRGIAAHHAGMLPVFKEVVEELFTDGLVRAVFATETLALGINMPARTVVLEKLDKWNGEAHVALTPGEYTQLTGRAGRRGHRRRGARGGALAAGPRPGRGRRAREHPYLPAQLQLPPLLQHGRQPHRPGRPAARRRPPRVELRPVPGRPGRGRAGPQDAPGQGGRRRARPAGQLRSRRLPRVRGAAPPAHRRGARRVQKPRRRPARAGPPGPRHPPPGRRHPRPVRPPGRLRGGAQPAAGRGRLLAQPGRRPARADRARPAQAAVGGRLPGSGRAGRAPAHPELVQRALAQAPPRSRLLDALQDRGPRSGSAAPPPPVVGWCR